MKLPRGKRLGVQSLGRKDINAPARKLASKQNEINAMVGVANAVGDVVSLGAQLHKEHQDNEVRDRSLEIQRDLEALYSENDATQQWDLDDNFQREKLEGVKFKKEDHHGNLRTVLDSAEVHAQVWSVNRDKIIQKGTSDLSAPQQAAVRKNLSSHKARLDRLTQHSSIQRKSQALKQQDVHSATNLVKADKLEQAVAVIADSNKFSDIEKVSMIQGLRVDNEKQRSDEILFSGDVEAIAAHMMAMAPENYQGVLEPREVEARRMEAERQINTLTAESQANAARQMERAASELEVGISRGESTYLDIEQAFNDDLITGSKRTQLIKTLDQASFSAEKKANQVSHATIAINNGIPLSPHDSDDKAAMDALYDTDPGTEMAVHIANKTGYIPKEVQRTFDGIASGGSPAQLREATQIFKGINATNPQALQSLRSDTRAILAASAQLGTMDPNAVKTHLDTRRKLLPAQVEEVEREYRRLTKDDPNTKALHKLMLDTDQFNHNNWFGMTVDADEAPMGFRAEFNALTKSYFTSTGDLGIAQKAAFDQLKSRWRTTRVNGDEQIMRDAPEAVYPGTTPEFLRKDIKHQLGKNKDLVMMSDLYTPTTRDYAVYNSKDGLLLPHVGADGLLTRWKPDVKGQLDRDTKEAWKEAEAQRIVEQEALEKRNRAAESFMLKPPSSSAPLNVIFDPPEETPEEIEPGKPTF